MSTETTPAAQATQEPVTPRESVVRTLVRNPTMVTFAALLMIIAAFSALAPGVFTQGSNFVQLAQNVAILTVVSVGTTFVVITAGVDLSIPSASSWARSSLYTP